MIKQCNGQAPMGKRSDGQTQIGKCRWVNGAKVKWGDGQML